MPNPAPTRPWLKALAFSLLPLCSLATQAEDNTQVKTAHVNLPKGPGSIEGLGKAFEPSLNTGGASYAVPIALPQGTAGHTPTLNLSYSSGQGLGVSGLGWQLDIPRISRSLENGQPDYSENDVLTYMGNTLVPLTDGTLAPDVQSQFIRFTPESSSTTNVFTARDKAGNRYRFGGEAVEGLLTDDFDGTYQWHLTEVTDSKGQSTQYHYQRLQGSEGVLYPKAITYGTKDSPYQNQVTFDYNDRPDVIESYQAGFYQKTAHRLDRINVYHGSRLLWSYKLDYTEAEGDNLYPDKARQSINAGLSLLHKVTRSSATASLPPMRFDYTRVFNGDADLPPTGNFPSSEDIDVNGNGQFDANLTEAVQSLPTGINLIAKQASLTDVTNDGLADWLYWKSGQYYLAENTGYINGESGSLSFAAPKALNNVPAAPLDDATVHLIDLDGDGQADFLHRSSDTQWLYYHNRGNGTFSRGIRYPTAPSIRPGSANVQFADINLDQRIDIITTHNGYWRYCLNGPVTPQAGALATPYDRDFAPFDNFPGAEDIDVNNNGRLDIPAWQCSGSIQTDLPDAVNLSNTQVRLADINGDRLKDVIWLRLLNGKVSLNYWLHKGMLEFAAPKAIHTNAPDSTGMELAKLQLKDINGDGLADLVYPQSGLMRFWLQQYDKQGRQWMDTQSITTPSYDTRETALFDGDVNGNGTADMLWASVSASVSPTYLDLSANGKANLLTLIDNGMGLRTHLTLQAAAALQAKDKQAGTPWAHTSPLAQMVVSQRAEQLPLDTTGDAAPDIIIQTYHYRDAYYDPYKKQFRGFSFARVNILGDNPESTAVNRHFFYTGAPDGQDNDGDGRVDEREADGTTEEQPLKGITWRLENTAGHITLADHTEAAPGALLQRQWIDSRIRRIHSINTPTASMNGKEVSFVEKRQTRTQYLEYTDTPKTDIKTNVQEHTYDDWGNITQTIDYGLLDLPQDNKTHDFTFATHADGIFQLPASEKVTDGAGTVLTHSQTLYDDQHLGQIRERGLATEQKQWIRDDDWATSHTQYDPQGNPILLIDADGRQRQLVWDSQWRTYPIEEWIFAKGISEPPLRVQANYDTGLGTLLTHTGFNSEQTHLAYDSFGRLLSIQKPYEQTPRTLYQYDFVDGFRRSALRFSSQGEVRIPNTTAKASQVTTTVLRDDGQAEQVLQYVDGLGRELATYTKTQQGFVVTKAMWHDHQGRAIKTFRPFSVADAGFELADSIYPHTAIDLDAQGRPLLEILPKDGQNRIAVRSFDYAPRKLTQTDPDQFQTIHHYDAADRVITIDQQLAVDDQLGFYATHFTYDPLGRLTRYKDAHNNSKTQQFNGLGHKVYQNDLDQGETHYRFDNAGNLLTKTDALGRNLHYRYDEAGRITSLVDHQFRALYAWHYDAPQVATGLTGYLGKLSWVEEFNTADETDTWREHYHYDLRGNLTHKTRELAGIPYQFHYQFDSQDRITRQIWPDGDSIDFDYNLRGLIRNLSGVVDDVQYHDDGQINSIHYANGTVQTRDYDPKGQLESIVSNGTSALMNLTHQYDLRGNIEQIDDRLNSNHSQAFDYDARSQLTLATGIYGQLRYGYDAIGNLTQKHWSPLNNPDNQVLHNLGHLNYGGTAGTENRSRKGGAPGPHAITESFNSLNDAKPHTTWHYNGIGQRTRGNQGNHYQWDQLARLSNWQQKTTDEAQTLEKQEDYRYDYKGRRLSKVHQTAQAGQLQTQSQVHYVDKSYEVRDSQTQKHLFLGNLRIARLETPQAEAFNQIRNYSLTPGWQPIYFAVKPEGSSLIEQLGSIQQHVKDVVYFNPKRQGYQQFVSTFDANTLSQFTAGEVYWLHIGSTAENYPLDWQIEGKAERPQHIRLLNSGWQQTTLPVTNDQDINAFAQSTAIERIWFYQQAEDRWYHWHKNGQHSTATTALKTLSPDSIYWVYTPREQLISQAAGINATRYFLHNNHLGSVALTTDDQGKLHTQAHYLPYGAYAPITEAQTDLAKRQPYGFSAKELDSSGLMYFEARYYDPLTTRFVTPDPLFSLEMEKCVDSVIECNLYQYTGNSPVGFVDPSGEFIQAIIGGGIAVAIDLAFQAATQERIDPKSLGVAFLAGATGVGIGALVTKAGKTVSALNNTHVKDGILAVGDAGISVGSKILNGDSDSITLTGTVADVAAGYAGRKVGEGIRKNSTRIKSVHKAINNIQHSIDSKTKIATGNKSGLRRSRRSSARMNQIDQMSKQIENLNKYIDNSVGTAGMVGSGISSKAMGAFVGGESKNESQ